MSQILGEGPSLVGQTGGMAEKSDPNCAYHEAGHAVVGMFHHPIGTSFTTVVDAVGTNAGDRLWGAKIDGDIGAIIPNPTLVNGVIGLSVRSWIGMC